MAPRTIGSRRDHRSTGQQYRFHVDSFANYIGAATPLEQITIDDLEAWVAAMVKSDGSPITPNTRNTKVSTVRAFFAWAAERSYIEVNPCIWLKRARQPKRLPKRVPREQVEKVLEKAPFRERTMIRLMLQLGLRRAEVANLRIEHWDRRAQTLKVTGKGSKERELPVTAEAEITLDAWCNYLAHCDRTAGPMWPSSHAAKDGMSMSAISKNITQVSRELGLHITPHQYRHTAASDALQAGATVPAVSRMLGHESLETTSVYVSVNDRELREQMGGREYWKGGRPTSTRSDHEAGT